MLEEKLRHEQEFHDRWASTIRAEELDVEGAFEAETAVENRYVLQSLADLRDKRVLDLGCGAGETSVYLAKKGARVTAVDLSLAMLAVTSNVARRYGVKIGLAKMAAERLPFAGETFDVVIGNNVLHHTDSELAIAEVARILKKDGKAIFVEPLAYNPVIQVYRFLARRVRTRTEKPLTFKVLRTFHKHFTMVKHCEFWLLTLIFFVYFFLRGLNPSKERYWKRIIEEAGVVQRQFRFLKRLDDWLLSNIPCLRYMCWSIVITAEK